MTNRNVITCSLLCRCLLRNLQVMHRRPVTHLSTFFHETSKPNRNFPPPPQTNIVVGHVYWCPPTMIAEIIRFKLFPGKHKVLYSVCILYPVLILYPVCSLHFILTGNQSTLESSTFSPLAPSRHRLPMCFAHTWSARAHNVIIRGANQSKVGHGGQKKTKTAAAF